MAARGLMQGCIGPLFLFLLFEKEQKDFVHLSKLQFPHDSTKLIRASLCAHCSFISLMQEKRNQRVHYPQGPLDRGMQTENCRNRQFSVGFGKPGRRLVLFYRQAHKS